MRRRAAALALPAGLLALSALTACAGLDPHSDSTDPHPVRSPAKTLAPTESGEAVEQPAVVDPGWDMAAEEAAGIFLSLHEEESDLEFRAVDSTGTILWTALRPRVCSGFLVSESSSGPVAVLMDQQSAGNGSLSTTASGFDLASGRSLWGPVDVPGPLLGSGLVFAGPPRDFIGEGGPRVALDPATGERLAVEDEGSPRVITLLGEHLILAAGDDLIGEDLNGHRLWTRSADDLGVSVDEAREAPWEQVGEAHALFGSAGERQRTLIDLRSGSVVATGIDAAGFDPGSRALVTSDSQLHGYSLDGTQQWTAPLGDDAELSAVGAGLVVTESGSGRQSSTETRAAASGKIAADAEAPEDIRRFGAPHHIAETGARLVGDADSPLLSPEARWPAAQH